MDKISLTTVGTYKEIEYLKKTLGPVLVSALAEVCVKRPTDPIEYLGHWLLRWRYNEELKRRDMENALEVIRQRQTAKCEREMQIAECKLPLDPYGQGVIPNYPFMPPGYGGPVNPDDLKVPEELEEEEEEYEMPGEDYTEYEMLGEGGYFPYGGDNPNNYNYNPEQGQYDQDWTGQGQGQKQGQVNYEDPGNQYNLDDPNNQGNYGNPEQQQQY